MFKSIYLIFIHYYYTIERSHHITFLFMIYGFDVKNNIDHKI